MKRIILYLSLVLAGVVTYAQHLNIDNCETSYRFSLTDDPQNFQYEYLNYNSDTSNIIRPTIFESGCISPCLWSSDVFHSFIPYQLHDTAEYWYSLRQPYHSDSAVAIDGVVYYANMLPDAIIRNFQDTSCFIQIMDANGNILRQARYDTMQNMTMGTCYYAELFQVTFDSPVVVTGDYYVAATFGHPNFSYWDSYLKLGYKRIQTDCDFDFDSDKIYKLPEAKNLYDSVWYDGLKFEDTSVAGSLCLYPRIDTSYNVSSIAEPVVSDKEEVRLYPNPAENILDITSKCTINTIEIADLQGRKRIEKNYNNRNAQADISSLSSGVYLVTIYTNKGAVREKFVKR